MWEWKTIAAQQINTSVAVVAALIFAVISILMMRNLRTERKILAVTCFGFGIAIFGQILGAILEGNGYGEGAQNLTSFSVFVEGLATISLACTTAFRVVLPAIGFSFPRILRDVSSAGCYFIWGIFWMQSQGFNVTGLIATSTVFTAVVGLSMQDTLGNLVSGLTLQLDASLHVGDWIKVEDLIGVVVETRWRFTSIQTNNWETVIIPNASLVKNKFMILGRVPGKPRQWRRHVSFNVDFRFAPSRVIETVEHALRNTRIPGVSTHPAPSCIQMDFKDSYARYDLRYWLNDIPEADPVDSEILSRIYFSLQRAGIALSIPASAVFVTQDNDERRTAKAKLSVEKRAAMLHRIDLFKSLSEDELSQIAEQLVEAPFTRGEVITRQGAVAHWLYLLIEGEVEVFVENGNDTSVKIAQLGPGTCFGEWGLMTGEPRDATVIASGKVDCYKLGTEGFSQLIRSRPEIVEELGHVVAERRVERLSRLESYSQTTHAEKLTETKTSVLKRIYSIFGIDE